MTVDHLKLGLTLKAKNERVLRLSVFCDRSMQLRQTLQTRQLVQHEPDRMLALFRFIQETQYEQVNPETMKRTQGLAFAGFRRNKDPSFAVFCPFGCSPMTSGLLFPWKHSQAIGNQTEGGQNAVPLLLRSLG